MKNMGYIVMAAAIFTGVIVFGAASADAATDIVLWHSYRAAEKDALTAVVDAFNSSQSEISVTLLQVPHDAYPDKITAAIPRGRGPDVFIFAHDRIGDWAVKNVIQPIGFWADDTLKNNYLPITIKALQYEGELYGLPTAYKCTALFYNRKLLGNPPADTASLIDMAKKLTDPEKKQFGLVYENGLTYYNACWIYGFNGGLFDSSRNPRLNDPANAAALTFSRDLLRKHRIMPEEISNSLVTSLFNENRAAMVISGPWFRAEISPEIEYGIAPLPVINEVNSPAKPFLSVEGILMSAQTEHPIESMEVMKALTSSQSAVMMATRGKQPVAAQAAYQDPAVRKDPWLHIFKEQLESTVIMPNFPEMRMAWTPMDIAISKVINKGVEPAEALEEAQEKLKKDIDLYRK